MGPVRVTCISFVVTQVVMSVDSLICPNTRSDRFAKCRCVSFHLDVVSSIIAFTWTQRTRGSREKACKAVKRKQSSNYPKKMKDKNHVQYSSKV